MRSHSCTEVLQSAAVSVTSLFVGEGWHLTLGALFMLIVIFLPGGLMEGFKRISAMIKKRMNGGSDGVSQFKTQQLRLKGS